ncbi:hypothetical protein B0H13DRAFT_2538817 [Mycena leptocephala]|nr:hypothetical protein B0H13DRAFT_2538817 [Mycena leptocephala]
MDPKYDWNDFLARPKSALSIEAEANLKRGKELLKNKKPEQGIPFLLKALNDPENLDECNSASEMLPDGMVIEYLKVLELQGRAHLQRILGPNCFEGDDANECFQGAPHFWGLIETRPYMRVLHSLVRTYIKEKRWEEAVALNIEILRLCESDNMGHRQWMGPLLVRVGRAADALYFTQQWLEVDEVPHAGIDFAPPRHTPMSDTLMLHSAALAAFTLDGDSELARQYLHIAVQYPGVFIKVLGKFKERVDGDTHPVRGSDGPEDARDHLWLAQDLWMRDDVWNWVDSDPVVKSRVFRDCSEPTCKKKEERIGQWQKCSGCKKEWYCSRSCQKGHWPDHRAACKKEQEHARSMRW